MITKQLMERLFPTKNLSPAKYNLVKGRDQLIDALNRILPKYGINNHKRICAFLGNCGIETDYFKTTIEYASGDAYEGRAKLGNTQRGDGRRFKGRGLTQTTGRDNYEAVQEAIGKAMGINVVKNPEKLAEIEIAVESACIFWRDNKLNAYADRGEFRQLSGIVNRGDKNKTPLHWAKRNELYSKCVRYVPQDFSFNDTPVSQTKINDTKPPLSIITHPAEILPLASGANNQTVVLTPTEPPATAQIVDANPQTAEKSKVKEFSEKYLKHCPQDTLKNILAVVAVRVMSGITTLWTLGLSGQIFLIVAGILVAGFIAYSLYYYWTRIYDWLTDIADSYAGN